MWLGAGQTAAWARPFFRAASCLIVRSSSSAFAERSALSISGRLLLPASLDDYVAEDNAVRVVEAFIDELDLVAMGFAGATQAHTGRPAYHRSTMLKIYLYGYLNWIQSSRRLDREAQRNVELMWLTGRLAPDFKTIANFRRDNGSATYLAIRLERAAELLRSSAFPITEVAVLCGFRSTAHFSRRFRQRFDVSPSQAIRPGKGKAAKLQERKVG